MRPDWDGPWPLFGFYWMRAYWASPFDRQVRVVYFGPKVSP